MKILVSVMSMETTWLRIVRITEKIKVMKASDKKYPKARYDCDTNPQVYGFKVGKTYQFRDFGRGVEVFYGDGCSLAMGYNMFNECFTEL